MRLAVLLVAAGLMAAGCAGPRTVYHYDTSAEFEGLRTYAWLPIQMPGDTNRFVVDVFKDGTDRVLQEKGYTEVAEHPDFVLSMYLGKVTRSEVTDSGYRDEGWVGAVHTHIYEEGTMILDILEGGSKKVIWHGKATQSMNTSVDQEAMMEAHQEALSSLLGNFPPPEPVTMGS